MTEPVISLPTSNSSELVTLPQNVLSRQSELTSIRKVDVLFEATLQLLMLLDMVMVKLFKHKLFVIMLSSKFVPVMFTASTNTLFVRKRFEVVFTSQVVVSLKVQASTTIKFVAVCEKSHAAVELNITAFTLIGPPPEVKEAAPVTTPSDITNVKSSLLPTTVKAASKVHPCIVNTLVVTGGLLNVTLPVKVQLVAVTVSQFVFVSKPPTSVSINVYFVFVGVVLVNVQLGNDVCLIVNTWF